MKKKGPISLLFLMGLLVAGIAIYTYFSGFNRIVTERFDGRLWELPARVYARPLALYPGLSISPDTLAQELGLMTYQEVLQTQNLDIPGKYIRDGRNFTLFCKPFDFGDKKSLSYRLGIEFKANKILRLINLDSSIELDLVRLDPVLVGSFYPASKEDRIIIDIKETPDLLPRTLICVEDKTFYNHYGVEPRAILRALWVNIKNWEMTQGASTITQQLARNFFLTREKTLTRKVN
ncbi:MAG: transglycosylase domain-containing protein [Desulfobacula sp.]|jgi:penicillin-binding protein 1B|nr:transglycosylase domain-containing protein [Desulfobacula sp.]